MTHRVFVTSGASGIGREISRAFLASGAKVFTCDIDAKTLDALAKELPDVKSSLCDISIRQDIERMVPFAVEALGGLNVLVNNAGISGPTVTFGAPAPGEKPSFRLRGVFPGERPRARRLLHVWPAPTLWEDNFPG